jgi:hypothetical protein
MLTLISYNRIFLMAKRILCFGGKGNLGSSFLKALTGYNLTSIDLVASAQ